MTKTKKVTEPEKPPEKLAVKKGRPKQVTLTLPRLNLKPTTTIVLALMVVVFFFVGTRFNGLVAIAKAGRTPIFSWDIAQTLWQRYRATALNDLVYESMVVQKANQANISVTEEEMSEEIESITEGIGGQEELNNLLKQRGWSYNNFTHSVRLQRLARKLIESEIEITEPEIDAFIRDNATYLTASDSASQREEATDLLVQQRVSEQFQTHFLDLQEELGVDYYVTYGQ